MINGGRIEFIDAFVRLHNSRWDLFPFTLLLSDFDVPEKCPNTFALKVERVYPTRHAKKGQVGPRAVRWLLLYPTESSLSISVVHQIHQRHNFSNTALNRVPEVVLAARLKHSHTVASL